MSASREMRIVVALGGNALLRRGERPDVKTQLANLRKAAAALKPLAEAHRLIVTHGNGPQVGLLAIEAARVSTPEMRPLHLLDAETEGQIGYLLEQELRNALGADHACATLLTLVEVAADDPAFRAPTKPIGPYYDDAEAEALKSRHGWRFVKTKDGMRRVVASPKPRRILETGPIAALLNKGVLVICGGGGGVPVIRGEDGRLAGIDAVIDKDRTSALLAREIEADVLLMLTDVDAVVEGWNTENARRIREAEPAALRHLSFDSGSMGPKVEAGCEFVEATGGIAGIGGLEDASAILEGRTGTLITGDASGLEHWT